MENVNDPLKDQQNQIKTSHNEYNHTQTPPDNNLVWAILSTIFCCIPLGIVSIVKATKVNTLWNQGYYDAANKAASSAKKYAVVGAVIGVFAYILLFIFYGLLVPIILGEASKGNL